jgi:ferric-dicitrate binding protein FerR (iron transport regulator)
MNYKDYQTEDFLADPYFQQWVLKPDQESDSFWRSFLDRNPDQKSKIDQASRLLQSLHYDQIIIPGHEIEAEIMKINQRIDLQTDNQENSHQIGFLSWGGKIAASISLLLIVSISLLMLLNTNRSLEYFTDYGETLLVKLPDGTEAVLNGNSRLTFEARWSDDEPRKVHLQGEAFFEVAHEPLAGAQEFIVETHDLNVEVLGTSFNLKTREKGTEIVLNSGKVQLNLKDTSRIQMIPGDFVKYKSQNKSIIKQQVDPSRLSAWKDGQLIFEETSLQEIAEILEDTYGYEIRIQNVSLLDKEISGTVPTDNMELLLALISTSINAEFTIEGKKIIIK